MAEEVRICQNCKQDFVIEPDDFAFYERINVPPPTFCPQCRLQRRLAFRNERTLYRRVCDLCKKEIVARFPPETKFPVYCSPCSYSDNWDPLEYGQEYDFSKPFFTQFRELADRVPKTALFVKNAVNSDYSNQSLDIKNVFFGVSVIGVENGYNICAVDKSRDVVDVSYGQQLEQCGYLIDCASCTNVVHSRWAKNCMDSQLLYDVRGSSHCTTCVNVRNAKYQIFNTQYTPEEYKKRLDALDLGSYRNFQKLEHEFEAFSLQFPRRFAMLEKCSDVTGDNVQNTKNSRQCFDCYNMENCKNILRGADNLKDCQDCNHSGLGAQLCWESASSKGFQNKFSYGPYGQYIQYSWYIPTEVVRYVFGCISFHSKKEYCILNKQYTKEEYEGMVPRIIKHMNAMPYTDKKGRVYRYGEFFPIEFSDHAYNETLAQEVFPLTQEETEQSGFIWLQKEDVQRAVTLSWQKIPDHIHDVTDAIMQEAISCEHEKRCSHNCSGAFRIFPQELAFCRKANIPLPRICPNCRYFKRLHKRNPPRLWSRQCQCGGTASANHIYTNTTKHLHGESQCPNTFMTSFALEHPEIVYCEQCYQAEVA